MLNKLRRLTGRKGNRSRPTMSRSPSRRRQVHLTLEQLEERALLAVGSGIPSLPALAPAAGAEVVPPDPTRSGLGDDHASLPRGLSADTADGEAHRVTRFGSKPGGAGDGISPAGLIDRLFASDGGALHVVGAIPILQRGDWSGEPRFGW
jgi:hypothetical protein